MSEIYNPIAKFNRENANRKTRKMILETFFGAFGVVVFVYTTFSFFTLAVISTGSEVMYYPFLHWPLKLLSLM
jgi:hypothetical protein